MKFDSSTFRLTDPGRLGNVALGAGVVFLAISLLGFFQDKTHFFLAYMTAFFFWLSIGLGALFFTMLHHLTGAKWSIVVRRLSEAAIGALPLMLVLFIPLLFGINDLFHWSHPEIVAADELLQKKAPYLNTSFFLIRSAGYFLIWILLSRTLIKTSLKQDEGHQESYFIKLRKVSAPGMFLFAITITFASFDWLMSLDAHWFSTIFGVYVFSGSFLAGLCFLILVLALLLRNNVLGGVVSVEHFHDLGKLTFAFIIFWTYMAFSQYFLIWYANLPEENYWYLYRWDNSWEGVGLLIIFGHFVFPFLALITRAAKRSIGFLSFMAGWILFMHFVDLYWIVFPTHYREGMHASWMDLTCLIGLGGIFVWYVWRRFAAHPLVPVKDPGLAASIQFTNN